MAMYRIIDGGTIYTLDAVLEGEFSFRGRLTEKPIQEGALVTDHYVNLSNGITFSGVISDVKRFTVSNTREAVINQPFQEEEKSTLDFITELKSLKESGRTFTLEVAPSSGTTFTDCIFTELTFSNNQKKGQYYENNYSFNVRATVQQIRKSKRASVVAEADIVSLKESTQPKTTGSGANVNPSEEEERQLNNTINSIEQGISETEGLLQ